MRVNAHDCSFCGGSLGGPRLRRRPKGFAIALWKPSPDRLFHLYDDQRWQVAAALSAAVTTTEPIGDRTQLSGETK